MAVFARGLATRLRAVTEKIPKTLVDVAGAPFVQHRLRLLREAGVRRAVTCLCYGGAMMIQEVMGDARGLGVEVGYWGRSRRSTGVPWPAFQRIAPLTWQTEPLALPVVADRREAGAGRPRQRGHPGFPNRTPGRGRRTGRG